MLIPLFFSYAEIHYSLKFLKPRYFRKFPEIIADMPKRVIKGYDLPILIILKDSNIFPIELENVDVFIHHNNGILKKKFSLQKEISQKYFSEIFYVNLAEIETEQKLLINVKIHIKSNTKNYTFINDNYKLDHEPFHIYYSSCKLPFPKNWYAGDPHYHSNFTDDQVEFGADIPSTKIMAKAMGLSWFFVTDHSYDLDDKEDNYLENDHLLQKWETMKTECIQNSDEKCKIVFGEEISIGNSKSENVHLLAINNEEFIQGKGDGAEKWFKNFPDTLIKNVVSSHKENNLFIAAHPAEKAPFMQKLTLRRGEWSEQDFVDGNINLGQFINSNDQLDITNGIQTWVELLLNKNKIFLIAGNDAHGNFNSMRQIKSPFWKLFRSEKQIFGNFMTVFYASENNPIKGLKSGKIIVSNGPFLDFKMGKFNIGETANSIHPITFETQTLAEFGSIKKIYLHIGDYVTKTEQSIEIDDQNFIPEIEYGYIRMSMITNKKSVVFTNPIWINLT